MISDMTAIFLLSSLKGLTAEKKERSIRVRDLTKLKATAYAKKTEQAK